VRDLILAIVTKSANDAATVLGEGLGGSEAAFAAQMTSKARQLGMDHTTYRNASGLPDPDQQTTARDVARLALALYHDFPREYRYFATRDFEFRGEIITGHDHLLDWYPGADGIKTGFINASGYNLATSAVQSGHRLIGVVMGGRTFRARDEQMAAMLDQGFAELGIAPAPRHAAVETAAPPQERPAAEEASPARLRSDAMGSLVASVSRHSPPAGDEDTLPPRAERWGIQIGAFHDEAAAERAAQNAGRLRLTQGKPQQIVPPSKSERNGFYRARLLHFSSKEAHTACAALHRKGIACEVVRPDALKYASG